VRGMSVRSTARLITSLSVLFALCSPALRAARASGKETVPGDLFADPPTLHCLGFRWLVSGDDNGTATVTVSYRPVGEKDWRAAHPLLRVNRETVDPDEAPFTAGNLFAGSILNLAPGSAYEVMFRLRDPDGGASERTLSARTRALPATQEGLRRLHVYPDGYVGPKVEPTQTLAGAARQARAGDVVLLHAGTHAGPLLLSRSGTAEQPVVFRGAGDGVAVLRGPGVAGNVVEASGTNYVSLEGLTVTGGRTGIKANGCVGLTVRDCRFEEVSSGIVTLSAEAAGWYIADNDIIGRVRNWYPRVDSADTGISCAGRGHVIARNRVRAFWDCISIANYGKPKPEWAGASHPPQVSIDIFGNDCSEALDDGIEADGGLHNVRVFDNRVTNVHTGISAQPNLGGPLYLLRNVVYNTTNTPLKLHNSPSGLLVYHNTLIGAGAAFTSWPPAWRNAAFRNNLFLGTRRYAMETGSPDKRTSLDYNGYARAPGYDYLVRWSADNGKSWGKYSTLAEFTTATGHEQHGRMIDYSTFERAVPPIEGRTHRLTEIDVRLKAGSPAIDAGCNITGVNEGFLGVAPDLGACEYGRKPPSYGPTVARGAEK
jgi:hypothetical protein